MSSFYLKMKCVLDSLHSEFLISWISSSLEIHELSHIIYTVISEYIWATSTKLNFDSFY